MWQVVFFPPLRFAAHVMATLSAATSASQPGKQGAVTLSSKSLPCNYFLHFFYSLEAPFPTFSS